MKMRMRPGMSFFALPPNPYQILKQIVAGEWNLGTTGSGTDSRIEAYPLNAGTFAQLKSNNALAYRILSVTASGENINNEGIIAIGFCNSFDTAGTTGSGISTVMAYINRSAAVRRSAVGGSIARFTWQNPHPMWMKVSDPPDMCCPEVHVSFITTAPLTAADTKKAWFQYVISFEQFVP